MPVVGRLDQYSSVIVSEFDEISGGNVRINGVGTYFSSEFSENIGIGTTLRTNVFSSYDLVYDEFAGVLYGPGQGTFMRQNTDDSVFVYNEIDEISPLDPINATVNASSLSVNEGSSVSFTVTTNNFNSGTLYWSLNPVTASINQSDFSSSIMGGPVSIASSTGTVSLTLTNDVLLEGIESFRVLIRTDTTSGNVIGVSSEVTIQDTSKPPTAAVVVSSSTVEEGSSVTFSAYTNNFVSGTLYWSIAANSGTIVASDFSPAALTGSFSITSSFGSFSITLASDIVDANESFIIEIRTDSTSGTIIGRSSVVTIIDASAYAIASGTKAPVFGSGGGTYPPSGWTGIISGTVDDNFLTINLPFSFRIAGTLYNQCFIGSNTYLTFGGGSGVFSGLSASNPAFPKFMFGAADNSYQRISTVSFGTDFTRIRYEGNGAASGTAGSPGIVLEITLFNPSLFSGRNVLELLVGNHNRTSGVSLVGNAFNAYATFSISANQSYVFDGDSFGTAWTITSGRFISGTNY